MEEFGLSLDSDEIRQVNPDGWFYCDEASDWRYVLWAENWPSLSFYIKWNSQWRVVSGMSGIHFVGLDYGVLLQMLDRLDLSKDEYDDMLGCLREIEIEARQHLNKAA